MGTHHSKVTALEATDSKAAHRARASTLPDTIDDGKTVDGKAISSEPKNPTPTSPEAQVIHIPAPDGELAELSAPGGEKLSPGEIPVSLSPMRNDPLVARGSRRLRDLTVQNASKIRTEPRDISTLDQDTRGKLQRQVKVILANAAREEKEKGRMFDEHPFFKRLAEVVLQVSIPKPVHFKGSRERTVAPLRAAIITLFGDMDYVAPKCLNLDQ